MRIIVIMVCLFLASCVGNYVNQDPVVSQNQTALRGDWGWDNEQCINNPMTISFSSDGKSMFHDSKKGMFLGDSETAYKRSIYTIHAQSNGLLHTSIVNEDRRDSNGKLVSWDLVIQNENAFCWHRTDWRAGSCTKNLVRCQ